MALEVELQQNIVAARRGVGIFGQQHRTESNPSRTERSRQRNDQELPLLRAQDGTSLTSTRLQIRTPPSLRCSESGEHLDLAGGSQPSTIPDPNKISLRYRRAS